MKETQISPIRCSACQIQSQTLVISLPNYMLFINFRFKFQASWHAPPACIQCNHGEVEKEAISQRLSSCACVRRMWRFLELWLEIRRIEEFNWNATVKVWKTLNWVSISGKCDFRIVAESVLGHISNSGSFIFCWVQLCVGGRKSIIDIRTVGLKFSTLYLKLDCALLTHGTVLNWFNKVT